MDFSHLKRPLQPMPDDVRERLLREGLMDAFQARPAYQQNNYLGWFTLSKREETRQKHIDQMIDELRDGHLYMGMRYQGQARARKMRENRAEADR